MTRALLLLAAAALLAWLLWPSAPGEGPAPEADLPSAPSPRPTRLTVRGHSEPPSPTPTGAAEADEVVAGAPETGPWLSGRIEVAEIDGTRYAEENGELHLHLATEKQYDYTGALRVPVRGGRFRLRQGAATQMVILRVVLRDRPAVLRGIQEDGVVPLADAIRLEAVWKAKTVLDVVDAETGRPLQDVEVAYAEAPSYVLGLRRRGATDVQSYRGNSPLTVPGVTEVHAASARAAQVVVRAKGYGFKRVALDLERGGRREIRLERGGALRLEIEKPRGHVRCSVRLSMPRDAGKAEDDSSALYGGDLWPGPWTLDVPNLPAGLWTVTLVRDGRIAVRRSVRIAADTSTTLKLAFPPKRKPKPKSRVSLTLDIEVAEGWPLDELEVWVGRQGARPQERRLTDCTPTGGRTWRWTLEVPNEKLFARIRPTGVIQRVHDPSAPNASTRLRVAAPADVTIACAWKNGEAAAPARLYWTGTAHLPKAPWRAGGMATLQPDGRFRLRCVPMPIVVRAVRPTGGFSASALELHPRPGPQEARLDLERLCAVRFELFDGETRVPWHVGNYEDNKAEPLFDTPHHDFDFDGRTGTLLLDPPGRWRFTLQPGPDFHVPPPIELVLRRGDNGIHRVPLRRK